MSTTSDAAPTRLRRALDAVIGSVTAAVRAVTLPPLLLVSRAIAPGHWRQASYIRPRDIKARGPRSAR